MDRESRKQSWPLSRGIAVAVVVVALEACGSGAQPSAAPATVHPTTTASPTTGLAGSYTVTLAATDASGPVGHTFSVGDNAGIWTLVITSGDAHFVKPDGGSFPLGSTFSSTSDQVTVGPDPNCKDLFPPMATDGIYTYVIHGGFLTFQLATDSCIARAATLTLHPWHKQ